MKSSFENLSHFNTFGSIIRFLTFNKTSVFVLPMKLNPQILGFVGWQWSNIKLSSFPYCKRNWKVNEGLIQMLLEIWVMLWIYSKQYGILLWKASIIIVTLRIYL